MVGEALLARPTSCSRRTTNNESAVDRLRLNPHCFSGKTSASSQKIPSPSATALRRTSATCASRDVPRWLSQRGRILPLVLYFDSDFLYPCGTLSDVHNTETMLWKWYGSHDVSSSSPSYRMSSGELSQPVALPSDKAPRASLVSRGVSS